MAGPSRMLFDVAAGQVRLVTPHMKRIRIDASALPPLLPGLPAQWLKVFVPGAASGRAYTVRHFDARTNEMDLDFVLHGDDGLVSAWAARVEPGDAFKVSATHPRGGFFIQPAATRYLLIGDETALPAIGAILERLPAHACADVLVEVAHPGDEQEIDSAAKVDLTWLHREAKPGEAVRTLESAARAIRPPDGDTVVWIAAESSIVKITRQLALNDWGIARSHLHAAGYWKQGEPDHRDVEAAP